MEFAKLRFPSGKKVSYSQKGKQIRKSQRKPSNRLLSLNNKSSYRDHAIVPDRFRTKMSVSYQGYIAVGATSSYFDIYGNSLYQPFTTSRTIATLVTGVFSSNTAASPIGYTELAALYNEYRVRGTRIKLTATPQNQADTITLVITPVCSVNGSVAPPVYSINQRYSRWKQIQNTNNVKENTIIHYMPSNKVLGLTKQQYDDQLPVVNGNAPPASLDWYWQVQVYTNNGSVTAGQVMVTVELDLYVEFSDPLNMTT